jgi:UDP-N-acetylmuramoyl-L-alanyl-D-glutamate--2,6-diaminopimelate ligase
LKSLNELLSPLQPTEINGSTKVSVLRICCDSRQVEKGSLFFALQGEKLDGNRFVQEAVHRGAVAVVSDADDLKVPHEISVLRVKDARRSMARAAAAFYGHPTRTVQLVGITGTNGKTTTSYVLHSIFRARQETAGLIGTIECLIGDRSIPSQNTTPESIHLQGFLAELRDQGCHRAVMEVSSHALEMHRVDGCHFKVAVFTNLTRDHLDFHQTMDRYFDAKRKLFFGVEAPAPEWAVLNVDDDRGVRLSAEVPSKKITYGLHPGADVYASGVESSFEGLKFTARTPRGPIPVESTLAGTPNVYNILAALASSIAMEIDMDEIREGIRNLRSVPGRFERVDCGQPFAVVVDYAHTDDALKNVLTTARALTKHRVITVFGCGGDRDRSKRPLMGEVAGRLSDFTILTSDNPRSEDPLRIIADAVVGLQRATDRYAVEPDRGNAIRRALEGARAGDIVLLTGKGHETYQILADHTLPFDDREVAREILTGMGYSSTVCN